MSEKVSVWNSAGKAGLVLGGVSVLYMVLTSLTGSLGGDSKAMGVVMAVVNVLLWVVKFGACIYLMRYFMLKFSEQNPSALNSTVFRFGTVVAFYSALIVAAYYLAYVLFIAPDTFSEAMEMMADNPMMDSASMDAVEQMMPKMPAISFFVQFGYCWLFGTVLSAIFSKNIPSRNPFSDIDKKPDDQ